MKINFADFAQDIHTSSKFKEDMTGRACVFYSSVAVGKQAKKKSMASKLRQLQEKASQASQYVAKHGTVYYKQLLEQNKQYIKDPPTVETCNELAKQLLYTRLASIPGRTECFWKELDYVKNMWKNRQDLAVEDVSIAALFRIECFAWFCAGEIVGRGFTFTGYYP